MEIEEGSSSNSNNSSVSSIRRNGDIATNGINGHKNSSSSKTGNRGKTKKVGLFKVNPPTTPTGVSITTLQIFRQLLPSLQESWLTFSIKIKGLFAYLGHTLSTHQIRTLLFCSLVICSLLSPALLLYFEDPDGPTSEVVRRGRGEMLWELEGMKRQGVLWSGDQVCWDQLAKYYQSASRKNPTIEVGKSSTPSISTTSPTLPIIRKGARSRARVIRMEQILVSPDGGIGSRSSSLRNSSPSKLSRLLGIGGGRIQNGVLSKRILHHTLMLQQQLEKKLLEGYSPFARTSSETEDGSQPIAAITCVKDLSGRCAIVSPTEWWEDEGELLGDRDVHETLSSPPRKAIEASRDKTPSVPLTTASTLLGVGRDRYGTIKGARYLVLTFFLTDSIPGEELNINGTSSAHASQGTGSSLSLSGYGWKGELEEEKAREMSKEAWRRLLREVVEGDGMSHKNLGPLGRMRESKGKGKRIILKYLPHLPVHSNPRLLESIIFAIAYLIVFVYASLTMRHKIHHVHSKAGLVFTGIIQLIISGIMCLSLCWIMGLDVGLVPGNLIAFLVLVCGVDNMFVLATAVGGTNISVPVPERVAEGLEKIALSTVVTLAVELLISTILLRLTDVEIFRQIIVFAAIVLVVDFFLEITFFTTILSIDMQRLELADLLRQGSLASRQPMLSPSEKAQEKQVSADVQKYSLWSIALSVEEVMSSRAARTLTFSTLFLINSLLYSINGPEHFFPAFCSEAALARDRPFLAPSLSSDLSRSLRRGQGSKAVADVREGAGEAFWKLINPVNVTSVQIYVEPVSLVNFWDDGLAAPESLSTSTIVETSRWIKVGLIVAPIMVVMLGLYLLLLYLLKDKELVEMQRFRAKQERIEKTRLKGGANVEIATLKGKHAADVELVASNKDVVVSWAGLDDKVVVWRRRSPGKSVATGSNGSTQLGDFEATQLQIPMTAEPPSLTLLSVDDQAKFCAAAWLSGRILVWALDRKLIIDFSYTEAPPLQPVIALFSLSSSEASIRAGKSTTSSGLPGPMSPQMKSPSSSFISVHQNGTAVRWDCVSCSATIVFRPPSITVGSINTPAVRTLVVKSSSPSRPTSTPLLARVSGAGSEVKIYKADLTKDVEWPNVFNSAIQFTGPMTTFAHGIFYFGWDSAQKSLLLIGSLTGVVSLYDMKDGKFVCLLAELDGAVRQIRIVEAPNSNCNACQEPISPGIVVVCSTRTKVTAFRIYTPSSSSSLCICSSHIAGLVSSSAYPSQSYSTPKKPRRTSLGRQSLGLEDSSLYPSPMHGFHQRRNSGNASGIGALLEKAKRSPSLIVNDDALSAGFFDSPNHHGSESPLLTVKALEKNTFGLSYTVSESPSSSASVSSPKSPIRTASWGQEPSSSSSSAGDVPLFDISAQYSPSHEKSPTYATNWPELNVHEVFSTASDERGGWDVVDGTLIGMRRHKPTSGEIQARTDGEARPPTSWEVWSCPLLPVVGSGNASGGVGTAGALDGRLTEGVTALESLLMKESGGEPSLTSAKGSSSSLSEASNLRNRRFGKMKISSPLRPRAPSWKAPPDSSIRFEDMDLPFSRARPVINALSDTALAVGLGNSIAVISSKHVKLGVKRLPRGRSM